MKGVVVYQSWWGSCKRIAEAITRGLIEAGHEVQVLAVEEAGKPDPSLDFTVIGGATRWPGARPKIKRYAKKVIKAGMEGYEPPGKERGTLPETEVARAEEFGRELGAKLRSQ
jgi:flavodoxin